MTINQTNVKRNIPKFRQYDLFKAKVRDTGDISSVFTSLGKDELFVLPQKYAEIKRNLVRTRINSQPVGAD